MYSVAVCYEDLRFMCGHVEKERDRELKEPFVSLVLLCMVLLCLLLKPLVSVWSF